MKEPCQAQKREPSGVPPEENKAGSKKLTLVAPRPICRKFVFGPLRVRPAAFAPWRTVAVVYESMAKRVGKSGALAVHTINCEGMLSANDVVRTLPATCRQVATAGADRGTNSGIRQPRRVRYSGQENVEVYTSM